MSLQEMIRLHRQRKAEQYQREAPSICKRYRLNMTTDAEKVTELMQVTRELNQCALCQGGECPKQLRKYQRPEINERTLAVWYEDCPVAKRSWQIQKAKKILPARYVGKTFDDYEDTPDNERAIDLAFGFLERAERGLYYYGGFGTGKTFLATLLGKEWLNKGKSVIFGDVPKLLDEIKRTFNDPAQSSQSVLDKYAACDLLIMDDLGTGYMTAWNVSVLYQIINDRYNANKLLIVTSNYSLAELEAKLKKLDDIAAGRIVSRLKEMCLVEKLGGKDRRAMN